MAVAASILYGVTACRDAFPIASSQFVTTHGGIDPFQSYQYPLWSLLLHGLRRIPVGDFALRANLLNIPLAVLSLWLMYFVVAHIRHNRTSEENLSQFPRRQVGAVSGVFAAAFLAVSPPFWFIATRAHPMALNLFMLLGCAALLVRYGETQRKAPLYLACLLVGVGMVQFPTMILLAPCFGLWVLYLIWRARELTPGRALGLLGAVLLGYCAIVAVAAWFMTTETYALRQMGGLGDLVVRMIRDELATLRRSAPKVGWLTVTLFTLLPWVLVVAIPKRRQHRQQTFFGSLLLNGVLTVVGFLILFNTQLAPFRILELRNLVVTPYLAAACWMGYLAGYWHMQFRWPPAHKGVVPKSMCRIADKVYLPVLACVVAAALWSNARLVDPDQGEPAARAARELVANLNGRSWLLSNGILDSMLQLAAEEAGVNLTVIDTSRLHLPAYRRYLAGVLEEPRLKSLIEIGLPQMLSEWARIDPLFAGEFAVLLDADFWQGLGQVAVPAGVMFLGAPEDVAAPRDLDADLPFFAELNRLLDGIHHAPDSLRRLNGWLGRHVSKVANNTGYALEDQGLPDAAYRAYTLARELAPDNVSALLNISQLASREQRPEAEELAEELESLTSRLKGALDVWDLSYYWGYVRNPRALYVRGAIWARFGQRTAAIQEIQRAAELGGQEAAESTLLPLAALYGQDGDDVESERLFNAYLEKNPDDLRALVGLCRLEISRGNGDLASTYLDRLADLGAPEIFLEMQWGALEVLRGNGEAAAKRLDRALELEPQDVRAMSLRALLAADMGEEEKVESFTRDLQAVSDTSAIVNLTLAQLAVRRGDPDAARGYLDALVEQDIGAEIALQKLLSLDIAQRRNDLGEEHVKALLTIDPRDARANLYLGSTHYGRGEFREAEAAFRASLERKPSYDALNNLGWIMVHDGKYADGLELAEQAIKLNPADGSVWDTKGVALLKLGRTDEAEEALLKAAEYSRGRPSILVHLAEAYEEQGNFEGARSVIEKVRPHVGDFPKDLADQLDRIQSRLP